MRERSLPSLGPDGFHRLAYTEWGEDGAFPPVICAHGLTRQGRDFDFLAEELAANRRVVCPDFPGRGRSEWLSSPALYGYPAYLADMAALIARLGAEQVEWVGTSMGGLTGLLLAAQPRSPIRRLVLNDVGPVVPRAALARIRAYVGESPRFADLPALEAYLRRVHAPFGPLTDDQWRHLAHHSGRPSGEGGYLLHYDPAIAEPLRAAPDEDVVLWDAWDRLSCPVLVLRGAESDLLLSETVAEMRRRQPLTEVVELQGLGHAPALMAPEQIRLVRGFLSHP